MVIKNEEIQAVSDFPGTGKLRSLLGLQKALREETYETCAFWIKRTLLSGGTKREIAWLLRHPSWHIEEEPPLN